MDNLISAEADVYNIKSDIQAKKQQLDEETINNLLKVIYTVIVRLDRLVGITCFYFIKIDLIL